MKRQEGISGLYFWLTQTVGIPKMQKQQSIIECSRYARDLNQGVSTVFCSVQEPLDTSMEIFDYRTYAETNETRDYEGAALRAHF